MTDCTDRRGRKLLIVLVTVLAILVVVAGAAWYGYIEYVVRDFINNPHAELGRLDTGLLFHYLWDDCPYRAPLPVSRAREKELIRAAIARATATENPDGSVLVAIVWAWDPQGAYLDLPSEVSRMLPNPPRRAYNMMSSVTTRELCPHLPADLILRESPEAIVMMYVASAPLQFLQDTAKDSCLFMLNREDIGSLPKVILLARIEADADPYTWFAGNDTLLEKLANSSDEDLAWQATGLLERLHPTEHGVQRVFGRAIGLAQEGRPVRLSAASRLARHPLGGPWSAKVLEEQVCLVRAPDIGKEEAETAIYVAEAVVENLDPELTNLGIAEAATAFLEPSIEEKASRLDLEFELADLQSTVREYVRRQVPRANLYLLSELREAIRAAQRKEQSTASRPADAQPASSELRRD